MSNMLTDSLWKHIKKNSTKDGYVRREYDNGFVRLLCSTKEIDFTKDPNQSDDNVRWACSFIHSGKIEEFNDLTWEKMATKFENLSLEKKLGQKEMFND